MVEFERERLRLQNLISELVKNNSLGAQRDEYWEMFHERYPRYDGNITNVFNNGSNQDLENLYHDLQNHHQWYLSKFG